MDGRGALELSSQASTRGARSRRLTAVAPGPRAQPRRGRCSTHFLVRARPGYVTSRVTWPCCDADDNEEGEKPLGADPKHGRAAMYVTPVKPEQCTPPLRGKATAHAPATNLVRRPHAEERACCAISATLQAGVRVSKQERVHTRPRHAMGALPALRPRFETARAGARACCSGAIPVPPMRRRALAGGR